MDARLLFNAMSSSDMDGDTLHYAWYRGTNSTPFSTEATGTASLPRGEHTLTLVVSDGVATASNTATVRVLTIWDLIHELTESTQKASVPPASRKLLLNHLVAASQCFERGENRAGMRRLKTFQARLKTHVAGEDSAIAALLSTEAQQIVEQVSGM